MNGWYVVFWTVLSLIILRSLGVFKPSKKKNIKDATEAPIPKQIFSSNKKFFEKFPKKKNFKKKYNNAQRKNLHIPYSVSF